MPRSLLYSVAMLCVAIAAPAAAFDGFQVTEGPLTLAIDPVADVTEIDSPQPVTIHLINRAKFPLQVAVEIEVIDQCRVVGPSTKFAELKPLDTAELAFQIAAGKGTFSALYPIHARAKFQADGRPALAHAVRIFETKLTQRATAGPTESEIITVPVLGGVNLATERSQQMVWAYFDKPEQRKPLGWEGADPDSAASLRRGPLDRGGQKRQSLQMHPPFKGGKGVVAAEYQLSLPKTQPLKLVFFNAIRDSGPTEPPSDGVTFRVWVDGKKLFERHTDAKTWDPGEVDLSPYAGKQIVLRLESHPGPKLNTTCDSCFWGDPVVIAGEAPPAPSAEQTATLLQQAKDAVASGAGEDSSSKSGATVFDLGGGQRAALALGNKGLIDGALAFGNAQSQVVFAGLAAEVEDQSLAAWPATLVVASVDSRRAADGRLKVIHHLRQGEKAFDLTVAIWAEQPGLRVDVACPERVTNLAWGPTDQQAPQVYFGHGYCVVEPQAFTVRAGGHNLSTSHVGFDFAGGLSLLMATTTPAESLEVDPKSSRYTLNVHPGTTFTFVPGAAGAMDCALRYRRLCEKKAAPGVAVKAGRFVFDIWGGRYAENAEDLRRAVRYGLGNSLYILHSWQRWGYDYRLPDIYPPKPAMGTLEDMQTLSRVCAEAGVRFGLHDNYIDFYPDATGYSYRHITFQPDGSPRKAWINDSRDAQSYQFRPDSVMPFLKRNLELMKAGIRPTASFVDVFTSAPPFDYHDWEGKFHSRTATQACWAEAFNTIRDTLGDRAPTTSEAGGDYLVGAIDGADCQFLQLTDKPARYYMVIPCKSWHRVPWLDAVLHTRFSLHGVGYSNRYQGMESRPLHGIESDDYLSCELLTGHALMIDRTGMVRGAVRKHWLAQDMIEQLADDEITAVEFVGGDPDRLKISWTGGIVWVNRGQRDWEVERRTLPQYGYLARAGEHESSIERIAGAVVEQSRGPQKLYINGRGYERNPPLRIRPAVEKVEHLGGREFRLVMRWEADETPQGRFQPFVHFAKPQVSRLVKTGFEPRFGPLPKPVDQWKGTIRTGEQNTFTLPEDSPPGQYDILAGMVDASRRGGRRMRLLGDEDPTQRYRVGVLVVEGGKDKVTGIRFQPPRELGSLVERLAANEKPTDFGAVATAGAARIEMKRGTLQITPLPDEVPFELKVRVAELLGRKDGKAAGGLGKNSLLVEAVAADGTRSAMEFEFSDGVLTFTTRASDFGYVVRVK